MDREQKDLFAEFPSTSTLIILGCLVVLLTTFLVSTMTKTGKMHDNNRQWEVPKVVSSFLSEITESDADFSRILNTYVVTTVISGDEEGVVGELRDVLSFEYVLALQGDYVQGYSLKDSTDGYLEFCLLDSKGEETYPRIAFSYRLTQDGTRIADYSIGRLQPFSRRDEEYDARWG